MKIPPLQIAGYRFAPSLWPSLVFLMVFPALLGLGFWQMERADAKQQLVEQRAASELVAPLELRRNMALGVGDRYRPAQVRGSYVAGQQWLLDNRVYLGQPGYHVFTAFRIAGEDAPGLLINRGWVSVGASREFLPALPLPEGPVTLSGRLDSPASVGLIMGEVPLESVEDKVVLQSLDIGALAAARGMDLLRYALVIDEGQPGGLQHDWSPIPAMGPEKHLGYAVQWFGLAVALLIIYVGVNSQRNHDDRDHHVGA
jgi:surfeit locus 1 family protein